MASLLNISIDLNKIDKSKIVNGTKGKYYNLTVAINDDTNDYGQNVSVFEPQTKEEREAKQDKRFLGSGMVFWNDQKIYNAKKKENTQPRQANFDDMDSDLPF